MQPLDALPLYTIAHIRAENDNVFRHLKPHQPGTQRHLIGPVRVLPDQLATLCVVRSRHRVAKRLTSRRRSGKPVCYIKYTIHSTQYAVALASWAGGIAELSAHATLLAAIAALKNNSSAPHFPLDTATTS